MTATLIGVSGNDHITHHFVYPCVLLPFSVCQQFSEKSQEDSVFETFFFVPVAVPFILGELPEGRLDYAKGQPCLDLIVSKNDFFHLSFELVLHKNLYYTSLRIVFDFKPKLS